MVELDMSLVAESKRRKSSSLDERQLMVMNILRRRKVEVPVIVRVFGCSKNTAYYRAFTGGADSYPNSAFYNEAEIINAKVDEAVRRHGGLREGESSKELQAALKATLRDIATPAEIKAVNAEMTRHIERRRKAAPMSAAAPTPASELPPATSEWLRDDA